jgi:hypothetical protein
MDSKADNMIDSQQEASGRPALVQFDDKLWMAWKGEGADSRIFTSSLSGSTWSAGVPLSGISASSSPALAVKASELYLVWRAKDDNRIYWSKSSDGKAWSLGALVPEAASSDGPALPDSSGVIAPTWVGELEQAKLSEVLETSGKPSPAPGSTPRLQLVWKRASGKTAQIRRTKDWGASKPALVWAKPVAGQASSSS